MDHKIKQEWEERFQIMVDIYKLKPTDKLYKTLRACTDFAINENISDEDLK